MKIQELMNAKVSDVVSQQLADEINTLHEVQTRLESYIDSKRNKENELYVELANNSSDRLGDVIEDLTQLMGEEFKDSIKF
ncbi:MAG: hypothetical protein VB024_10615 [Dysgonamonadaceae bacterium]|nr:hypothetical protein [Dysgonamonadaceae bacterium]